MLLRPCWATSPDEALDLIDLDPWALLTSNGQDVPMVTAVPLLLDRSRGGVATLVGHLARANPHASVLKDGARCLAVFQGPRTYVSPSWYPARNMAPTMYHVLVEAEGVISLQGAEATRAWVDRLTARYEAGRQDQWDMRELPEDGIVRRMKAIVGFEIEVTRLSGKAKLGQDEPKPDALAVAAQLATTDRDSDRRLGEWVADRNAYSDGTQPVIPEHPSHP